MCYIKLAVFNQFSGAHYIILFVSYCRTMIEIILMHMTIVMTMMTWLLVARGSRSRLTVGRSTSPTYQRSLC